MGPMGPTLDGGHSARGERALECRSGVATLEKISSCLKTWAVFGKFRARFSKRKSHLYGVLNKVYLQNFLGTGVTFRDESN